MNVFGLPFVFFGVATMVTRRMQDESGAVVVQGTPAFVIGAVSAILGLAVFLLL